MNTIINTPEVVTENKVKIKNSFVKELLVNKYLYILTIPGILYYFIFSYLPMFGLVIAFKEFIPTKGILKSPWVGFSNFDFFFTTDEWKSVTINTLYLNALFIVTGLIAQIVVSIMISEINGKYFKKVTQSLLLFPTFLSWTVISMMTMALFSTNEGLVNSIFRYIGFHEYNFFQDPTVWPVLLILLKLWKGVGYGTVIYLATITGIDQEMYEAAVIDGATRLQKIFHITIPMLMPTTIMLLFISVGYIFYGDFGMIYAIVGDNPMIRSTTDVIDTFVFRSLRMNQDFGMSSAIGLYQSFMGFIIVILANTIIKKINPDSAML